MPVAINETFVKEQIDALQTDYSDVEIEQEVVEIPSDEFPSTLQNARDGYIGGAYAWVTRTPNQAGERTETYAGDTENRKRALLILPRGESAWGLPGGGVEDEESFEQAARREVLEEAGIECEITGLWHLRHVRWRSEDETDDRVSHSLHVFFDAEYDSETIAIQKGEVNGAAWFAEPPRRLMEAAESRAEQFFCTD